MTKAELRKKYINQRMNLSEIDKLKLDDLLLLQLQKIQLSQITHFVNYYPINKLNEPNTQLFEKYLLTIHPNLLIYYPKINKKKLDIILTNKTTNFKKNSLGVFEPIGQASLIQQKIDLIFVPLLIFDLNGYRLGYGKGFYDLFLKNSHQNCLTIGFSYFNPIVELPEKNNLDLPLKMIITPTCTYAF